MIVYRKLFMKQVCIVCLIAVIFYTACDPAKPIEIRVGKPLIVDVEVPKKEINSPAVGGG